MRAAANAPAEVALLDVRDRGLERLLPSTVGNREIRMEEVQVRPRLGEAREASDPAALGGGGHAAGRIGRAGFGEPDRADPARAAVIAGSVHRPDSKTT